MERKLKHEPLLVAAQVLQNEQDLSTKRNAFQFLATHAEERAVGYLLAQIDNVALWGDILQMAVLDLIRKVDLRPCQAYQGFRGGPGSVSHWDAMRTCIVNGPRFKCSCPATTCRIA